MYVRTTGHSVFKSFDVGRLYVDYPHLLTIARNRKYGWQEMSAKWKTFFKSLIVNKMAAVRDE